MPAIPRGLLGEFVGIEPDRTRTPQPPQVDTVNTLAAGYDIDALLVSVGANDVHFRSVVQFCAAVTNCCSRRFDPRAPGKEVRDRAAPTLDEVTAALCRGWKGATPSSTRRCRRGSRPNA